MPQVVCVYPHGSGSNTYFLTQDGTHCVVIDPHGENVLRELNGRGLKAEYVLLTHGHFDHVKGCPSLQNAGAKVGCLEEEKEFVFSRINQEIAQMFYDEIPPFRVDFTLRDGEEITLCGMTIRTVATPGHTQGGACYLCEKLLFSGDTLFCGSVGRTDFPTGNGRLLEQSVKKLYALAGDYLVYPGHDEPTTLENERKHNFFIRQ